MRKDPGKHFLPSWKEHIISKWANNSWRFRMENSFEEAIFNIQRDRPISWLLKQKKRLTSLHPDISEAMVHKRISRKYGGDLEHAIRSRYIKPCSTEYYIDLMEDITKTKIGRNWYKPPIKDNASGKQLSRANERQDRAPLKCHKCGSKSYLDHTCPKRTTINQIQIEKAE
ncbi:hypothetical protein O181_061246 [Austropuccinia psidii MF-1]|uniref:Uncharacterized protein n=1 Tax=Austropuccinia psidii MF-1 TaxID=1389203 RepID=A0A9Q3HXB7_9BASI|nr:hypothetical protein [Austropuccinia psidii MF-1]